MTQKPFRGESRFFSSWDLLIMVGPSQHRVIWEAHVMYMLVLDKEFPQGFRVGGHHPIMSM